MVGVRRLTSGRSNLSYLESRGIVDDAVQIRMLGGFRISFESRAVDESAWRLSKAKTLLQMIALAPGRKIHREQLMHHLWPDHPTDAASGNLYQVVHAARRALSSISSDQFDLASMLQFRQQILTLDPSTPLRVDVDEFNEAALTALNAGEPASYQHAIALYAGDLLPEHPYDEWIQPYRQHLKDRYWTLLVELAQLLENASDYPAALDAYRRATECDPVRERAHAGIMRVEAQLGQTTRALEQYDALETLLTEGIGTGPDAETRRLRDEIAGEIPHITLDPTSEDGFSELEAPPHNLPIEVTSFVGRELEISELCALLDRHRLVSITGPGGSGKTRLALAVASRLLADYPEGIWRVPLADTCEPDFLSTTIADALSLIEGSRAASFRHLQRHLASRRLMLILDGCEHLAAECADLISTLLSFCPELRVLVTSREPLRADGEAIWRIPLMDVPDRELVTDCEDIARADSVRLFIERARLAQPEFELTPSNSDAVMTVCARADGLPLAIELAAAKLRALSVEQVAARLDHSLNMLIRSSKNPDPAGGTLVYTLDWSYALLTETERLVFERASIFAGGWSLDTAEIVAAGGDVNGQDVVDAMIRLADKSLIHIEPVKGETRYRMLDTVRQYARDRLNDRGAAREAHQRHAQYFAAVLEPVDEALRGPEQSTVMDDLHKDHDNLRAAISWLIEAGQSRDALRFCRLISRYWALSGNVGEGRMWLDRALAMDDAHDHIEDYNRALFWLGRFAYLDGDYQSAERWLEQCLSIARERNDPHDIAASQSQLGHISWRRGDLQAARRFHESSLSTWRESGDDWSVAISLRSVGYVALNEGNLSEAQRMIERSLELFCDLEDRNETAHCMFLLGQIAYLRSDYKTARSWQEGSLSRFRIVSDWLGIVRALCEVGYIEADEGDDESACRQFQNCLERYRDVGSRQGIADCLEGFAAIAIARHQPERAARLLGAASTVRSSQGEPPHIVQQARRDRMLTAVEEMLSRSSREVAWYQGRAMRLEDVIDYALAEPCINGARPTVGPLSSHREG